MKQTPEESGIACTVATNVAAVATVTCIVSLVAILALMSSLITAGKNILKKLKAQDQSKS